jgi:hypothetical protein
MTPRKPQTPADALLSMYRRLKKWQAVADQLHENKGLVNAVAHGKRKAPNHLIISLNKALRLRLPLNEVPATPCRHCGLVHVRRSCPQRQRPRQYRSLWDIPQAQLARMIRERAIYPCVR